MAATELYSLRWNNFHSNLTHGFHELFQAGEMTDVNIAVEGQIVKAHKIVLSICSPYFKEIFKEMPCKHATVILKDISYQNMMDILTFMYIGEVKVSRDDISYFLRMAETLQVKGLTGDDSSETSSRKGDKSEVEDDDADLMQYNSLIDSDVELPSHFSTPRVPSPLPPPAAIIPISNQHQPPAAHSNQTTTAAATTATTSPPTSTSTSSHKKQSRHHPYSNCKRTTKSSADQHFSQGGGGGGGAGGGCSKTVKNETDSSKPNTYGNSSAVEDAEYFDSSSHVKTEKSGMPEFDEVKENFKHMLENNFGSSGPIDPTSPADNDVLLFSVDQKGHVYCPYCCRKFVNRYNLKVHIRDKHEDNNVNLDCRICGKIMRNRSCLRVHMYHHRKQQLDAAAAGGPSACVPTTPSTFTSPL